MCIQIVSEVKLAGLCHSSDRHEGSTTHGLRPEVTSPHLGSAATNLYAAPCHRPQPPDGGLRSVVKVAIGNYARANANVSRVKPGEARS